MIFERLTISPMMVVLLLLYGLLIAVFLVLWTALDLRRRQRSPDSAAATERPRQERQPERSATPATQPATAEPETADSRPLRPQARRTADSDSVVSYSVRPRVNGDPAPTAAGRPPAAEPQARTEPVRPPEEPDPSQEQPVGRSSRQPAGSPRQVQTETARLDRPGPADRATRPSGTERRRSEDAFERFLRSSADDEDF